MSNEFEAFSSASNLGGLLSQSENHESLAPVTLRPERPSRKIDTRKGGAGAPQNDAGAAETLKLEELGSGTDALQSSRDQQLSTRSWVEYKEGKRHMSRSSNDFDNFSLGHVMTYVNEQKEVAKPVQRRSVSIADGGGGRRGGAQQPTSMLSTLEYSDDFDSAPASSSWATRLTTSPRQSKTPIKKVDLKDGKPTVSFLGTCT